MLAKHDNDVHGNPKTCRTTKLCGATARAGAAAFTTEATVEARLPDVHGNLRASGQKPKTSPRERRFSA
ncbi:hypothetical protein SAMN05216188_113233 [Lentzea xinjiangensis]|uniref:Uncharacterized protein n=1 Tax=Lentzea xinjiangensis TaxID=402600 RepID=A0A1H9QXP0_9PSEU|nr:hypothetical protein SAMN05216188_113233 [Lentzea xinjiangensis]